ncbi:hypothetical protein SAMN06298216_3977 [Spirosomataceae bacterium TFI 002]|nr:hypothetical protein SAMN06298216_3977 [Spirosomataceae bacterium TFI 002]
MRKLAVLSIFALLVWSCEKEEVKIPAADQVEGRYTMNSFITSSNSLTLPYTLEGSTLSARALITKITETTVDYNVISTVESGNITQSSPELIKGVTVVEIGDNTFQINGSSGEKLAVITGNSIEAFFTVSGQPVSYKGTKDL